MKQTPTDAAEQAAFAQHMAFNVEAVPAGLIAAVLDIAEELKKNDVPHADAIILTAAAEFTAQLWQQTAHRGLIPSRTARNRLLDEIKTFWAKHLRLNRAEPETEQ